MPESDLLLHAPGFILLEWIIVVWLGFATTAGTGAVWWVYRDSRRGRKEIHEKIEDAVSGLETRIDEKIKPVQDGIDSHIKECQDLRVTDNRWMGSVNAALMMLTRGQWKPKVVIPDDDDGDSE